MEQIKAQARQDGFVKTLFGRKIHISEIDAKVPARRAFAERAAINAPIQGSAADIMRLAMVAMLPALADKQPDTRLLLQVHDELIFETPKAQADDLIVLAKEVMGEASTPHLALSVPLVVEAQAAQNWDEAH